MENTLENKIGKNETLKGELKQFPMDVLPEQVEGEHFSKTVLVYDEDLEDFDLGFFNYDTQKWDVMGGFQMKLICWSYIPLPHHLGMTNYKSILTD